MEQLFSAFEIDENEESRGAQDTNVEVSEETLLSGLKQRTLRLNQKQKHPPIPVVNALAAQLSDICAIGRTCSSQVYQRRIEQRILSSGHKVVFVGDRQMNWVRGKKQLNELICDALSVSGLQLLETTKDLRTCLRLVQREASLEIRSVPVTPDDQTRNGLIFIPSKIQQINYPGVEAAPKEFRYYNVGLAWADYSAKLDKLERQIDALYWKALKSERVVTLKPVKFGYEMVPFDHWTKQSKPGRLGDLEFALARDLPGDIFTASQVPKGDERNVAVEKHRVLAEQIYDKCVKMGKRISKSQYMNISHSRIGKHGAVSNRSIAIDGWNQSKRPLWADKRRVSAEEKLTDAELKDLLNRLG